MQSDPPAGVSASPVADNVMTWYARLPSSFLSRLLKTCLRVHVYCSKIFTDMCSTHRNAVIIGPADTPFEDGTFRLMLNFDEGYPNKAPNVRFVSQMFHPNVYATGDLCLDILQNRWSPTYDVAAILTSIQSLLNDPNTQSPANAEASTLYKENKREYSKRVRETVEKSWED